MEVFDVAVVGAGSAGCALAGRLAARTDWRIALVEAGPDYGLRAGGSWPADLVDARGRVHGLANVFVADASVVPRIPRANTNFTCMVIGARAADLLTHARD